MPPHARYAAEIAALAHVTRVAIAATHPAVRSALQALVATEGDLSWVETVGDARGAARCVLQHHPDVLLLAVSGALADHGAMIRELRTLSPETAVIVARTASSDAYVLAAEAAGAAALVALDGPTDDLLHAVHEAGRHAPAVH